MEKDWSEIDEGLSYIGYREAFELIHSHIRPLGTEEISLESAIHRIAAEDVAALVNHPSVDVALKDGFAIKAADVEQASACRPAFLTVIGSAFAGSGFEGEIGSGSAVKVCSGAPIPAGAEAVVPVEFCREKPEAEHLHIDVCIDAGAGRNILRAAEEVKAGEIIIRKGTSLLPGIMGLAAAAGINVVQVFRRPKAAIIGIGDEVVAPGQSLRSGQIYASNLITLKAWLNSFGLACVTSVSRDNETSIELELDRHLPEVDVILTSGGAWGSERDLVIGTLDALGWRKKFHHVRMGPGKGIAFGLWKNKPVFCLPGGPASNEMAFLQLALPGILRMSGDHRHPLQSVSAKLIEDLEGRHKEWTEFRDAVLIKNPGGAYTVEVYKKRSRLQAIAGANSLICIPEGRKSLHAGEIIPVQLLSPRWDVV
jgi:molybdopterin molybdotransferase